MAILKSYRKVLTGTSSDKALRLFHFLVQVYVTFEFGPCIKIWISLCFAGSLRGQSARWKIDSYSSMCNLMKGIVRERDSISSDKVFLLLIGFFCLSALPLTVFQPLGGLHIFYTSMLLLFFLNNKSIKSQ